MAIVLQPRYLVSTSAILMALAVCAGAFGAHAMKGQFDQYYMRIFEKAVFYQFIHILSALVFAIIFWIRSDLKWLAWIVMGFIFSTIIFSGSLYLLVFTKVFRMTFVKTTRTCALKI